MDFYEISSPQRLDLTMETLFWMIRHSRCSKVYKQRIHLETLYNGLSCTILHYMTSPLLEKPNIGSMGWILGGFRASVLACRRPNQLYLFKPVVDYSWIFNPCQNKIHHDFRYLSVQHVEYGDAVLYRLLRLFQLILSDLYIACVLPCKFSPWTLVQIMSDENRHVNLGVI